MKSGIRLLLLVLILLPGKELPAFGSFVNSDSLKTEEKKVYFTLRLGTGGYQNSSSPIGKLGGGQLALDIRHGRIPLALGIFTEYYTNSSDPTHSYEISNLAGVNCYYSRYLLKSHRLNIFAGPGFGGLKVPQGSDSSASGVFFDFEAGIHARLLWKFGLYGTYKYLYAHKEEAFSFSEHIFLLGLNFTFGL